MLQSPQRYSLGEEIANSITHGVGALLAIVGLAVLIIVSTSHGTVWHIASSSIFGTTLILLYLASTLYHSITAPRVKRLLRLLDHCAIYLLIAGTYTPFLLINLRGSWGWSLLGLVWGIALGGIILNLTPLGKVRGLSLSLYLILGWIILIAIKPLLANLDPGGVSLLVAGGLAYTGGVIFYGWQQLPYNHAIWHLFVLAGSICHFFAILFYVIPR
ncbi:MAG: hemolysin III family protein [Pelovirga sp.]